MKNIVILLGALALCVPAQAQLQSLSTTDGEVYTRISFERIEPDGLYIEYRLPGGGFGMSKVKFARLPRAQQKQFGFDRYKAREYEAAVTQANQDFAQELIQRDQTERNARRQHDLENERAYGTRMMEITRLNAAQAAAFYRTTTPYVEPATHQDLAYGTAQFAPGKSTTETSYIPTTPDLFPAHYMSTKNH